MSYDLAVFRAPAGLTQKKAGRLYVRLCEGNHDGLEPSPAVNAFYKELTAKHPEIGDVPEEEIDNTDLCPWSCRIDRSPGHIILNCVWSRADYVDELVKSLAAKHGLSVYDPQEDELIAPA